MTAKKTATPAPAPEMPTGGGSWHRRKDGSLERVEFTGQSPVAADEPQTPPDAPEQEG